MDTDTPLTGDEHPGIAAGWIRLLSVLEARKGSYNVLRLAEDTSGPHNAGGTFSTDIDASNRSEER